MQIHHYFERIIQFEYLIIFCYIKNFKMERKVDINIDTIIDKLLSIRSAKIPKQVNLLEG